jgi:PAS domain S-box-containing protein
MKPKTQEQLLIELEELHARLDEAEETLLAIRSGEVDALVVSGVGGEQVFTLKGADHSYRMLIEDMNEGALTLSLDGVILYCNRRFAEMLKSPLEKVIGSKIHTWIASASQIFLRGLLRRDDTQTSRRGEATLLAGDGTLAPVYLSTSVLQMEEMQGLFGMVATDLTEQKRTEAIVASEKLAQQLLAASNQSRLELLKEIEAREQAEEELAIKQRQLQTLNETLAAQVAEEVLKNREKDILLLHQDKLVAIGQLAAGVAHEINNPMGFIMSNLRMLKEYSDVEQKYLVALENKLEESCPEERRKQFQELRQGLDLPFVLKDIALLISESLEGAERVKRIVLDLKDFARLDEGKMNETDLNHCVKSTANIVRNEIRQVAELELLLNEISLVVCNPQQINQVIANLLVNASQAMDKHGVITVTSRQEGEQVVLSISDTGRGMTEEVRKRIFEPFFTTREVGEGTGLGLSIAYGIIKQHDGEITVQSEPGRGTTFTIRLPIRRT